MMQCLLDDVNCLTDEGVLPAVVMPARLCQIPLCFCRVGFPFLTSHLAPLFRYHIIYFPALCQCTINDCCYGPLVDCIKQYPFP